MKKCVCFAVMCFFVSPLWLDAAVVTNVAGKEIYVDAGKKDGVQIGTMMNVYRKKEIESEYGSMKFTTQIFIGRIIAYKVRGDNTVARLQEMTAIIEEGTQKAILKSDLAQPAYVVSADGLFRSGETDLLSTGIPTMRRLVGFIKRFDALKVRIEVHADSDTKNAVKLTRTQSKVIRDWLVKEGGIKKETLVPVGYGDQKPIAGRSKAGKKANRRVEIVIED